MVGDYFVLFFIDLNNKSYISKKSNISYLKKGFVGENIYFDADI